MANEIIPGAEFQALPLEYVVATPLIATLKAQAVAADAMRMYIERLIDPATRKPVMVDFTLESKDASGVGTSTDVRAPMLSIVPVPHMRIDSLNVQFKYEITQTLKDTRAMDLGFELGATSGGLLNPWVAASFKGSVASRSSQESTMNRSGSLDINIHASEAPIPEGLAKLLTMLSNSVITSSSRGTLAETTSSSR